MDVNKLIMIDHDVFYGVCDTYDLLILLVRLNSNWLYATSNYCFIIQINGCMYSFGWVDKFRVIMVFYVKLVNNKVVDNLLIYLLLNFHSHRPYGLRIMVVRSLLSEMLLFGQIWMIELFNLDNCWITLSVLKKVVGNFISFP